MSVVRAFYHATDARQYKENARFFSDNVKFDTWATGVNGSIVAQRHLKGKKALLAFLSEARGLRHRLPDSPPDGRVYSEPKLAVPGSTAQFMMVPDRKRPNGREYNPGQGRRKRQRPESDTLFSVA